MDLQQLAKKVDLVKVLGIDKLSKEEQESALEQMGKIVYERVLLRLVGELKRKGLAEAVVIEFLEIAEGDEADAEKMVIFLEGYLPEYAEFVENEIGKYREEMTVFSSELKSDKGGQQVVDNDEKQPVEEQPVAGEANEAEQEPDQKIPTQEASEIGKMDVPEEVAKEEELIPNKDLEEAAVAVNGLGTERKKAPKPKTDADEVMQMAEKAKQEAGK